MVGLCGQYLYSYLYRHEVQCLTGPLWFAAFRIFERVEAGEDQWPRVLTLPQTRRAFASALKELPPELRWKVHFIAAQTEERAAMAAQKRVGKVHSVCFAPGEPVFPVKAVVAQCLKKSRERLMSSMLHCPKNLKWKPRLVCGLRSRGRGSIVLE